MNHTLAQVAELLFGMDDDYNEDLEGWPSFRILSVDDDTALLELDIDPDEGSQFRKTTFRFEITCK